MEQYGRRLCLHVDDVPIREGKNPKAIEQELQKEFAEMRVELPEDATDRAHRIGKKYNIEAEEKDVYRNKKEQECKGQYRLDKKKTNSPVSR